MVNANPVPEVRKGQVLAICCMSLLLVGMDATIVNVALPSIRRNLNVSISGLQWTIDAYTLVLASLLVLAGSLGDRLGRRRVFQTGLALFTLGSLLCGFASGEGTLVAFRILQAVGGAMMNPVAVSIITNTFTDPKERARAIGTWGAVVGVAFGLGPVLGGVLLRWADWRAIFWVNVPIGIAAIVLVALRVPESRAARARRVDPVGQLLVIALLSALTYGIIELPRRGAGSPEIIGCFALAFAALVGLLYLEPRRADPLIELRFFRSIPFAGASVVAIATFGAWGAMLFLNSLYLQGVRGYSPLTAGLMMLPMSAMIVICAPISGRLVATRGPRLPMLLAGVVMLVAALMLTRVDAHTSVEWLLACYLVFAVGFGLINAPITNTAVSGMPRDQAGVAAAIASTSRQVGATLGVAIVGATITGSGLRVGKAGWWVVVAATLIVLVVGLLSTGPRAQASADRLSLELG